MKFLGLFIGIFFISNFLFPQTEGYPKKLLRFHEPIPEIKLGDWRSQHTEKNEALAQYTQKKPIGITEKRTKIYLLPLGEQTELDSQLVQLTAEYLEAFFGKNVQIQPNISTVQDTIPETNRRIHRQHYQLHTRFVLYNMLKKNLPADALTYVALSSVDLYPAPRWNFVFGEATLRQRVAVVSSYRHKVIYEALSAEEKFQKIALRVFKTATHEIGHTFSMPHCVAYECLMNGSSNQRELDQHPWHLCPICSQKLDYALKTDLKKQYTRLRDFFGKYGFREQAQFCRRVLKRIQ